MGSVYEFVSDLRLREESLETEGNCRNAALLIARELARNGVETNYLAWPDAQSGKNVHYAVLAMRAIAINTIPARGGFPEYIGPWQDAPGKIPEMKIVDRVI